MARTAGKKTVATESTQEFASGRSVIVKVVDRQEQLEVRSPQGDIEVKIVFDDKGPVVQLRGARLELTAPDNISVRCNQFNVETTQGTTLRTDGDLTLAGKELKANLREDVHIDGELIRFNCQDRTGRKHP